MLVRAEGCYTVSDLWFGTMLHSRRAIAIFGSIAAAIFLFSILTAIAGNAGPEILEPLVLLGLFWIAWLPLYALYACYRSLKRSPNLQGLIRYDFAEEGYDLTATHSTGHVNWSALVKWREGKRSFLFYTNPRIASVIPKHFFQNPADIDSLRLMLETKVQGKRRK